MFTLKIGLEYKLKLLLVLVGHDFVCRPRTASVWRPYFEASAFHAKTKVKATAFPLSLEAE